MIPPQPQPVSVAGNRWVDIHKPELDDWEPSLHVSVIIPYYERSRELNLTLAGLSQQTYPHPLFEVIVVDDGSPTDPPRPSDDLPFELTIVTQEDRGYGLARARNLGARNAKSDIIVFIDCDMIPERQHLAAHARWHHAAKNLITIGFRFHADFDDLTPDDIATAVGSGRVDGLFPADHAKRPEWIEGHMTRTNDLLGSVEDQYLAMSGGNLGIDKALYWAAGGNNEDFARWGGEDNEFAYRAMQLGAVVIPERQAVCWHQGEGHEPSLEEREAIRLQMATLKNLIADESMRSGSPGRGYSVPRLTVHVDPFDHEAERVAAGVDSLLASDFTDLVIGIGTPKSASDAQWLRDTYGPDSRVYPDTTESDLENRFQYSPLRMSLPAAYGLDADALPQLVGQLGGAGVGALHITLPGLAPKLRMAKATLTRAVNRAQAIDSTATDELIGRLFGERWLSGAASGFWIVNDVEEARKRIRERRRPFTDQMMELELSLREADLAALRSRRAIRLADALGSLVRARSWIDFREAIGSLARVIAR